MSTLASVNGAMREIGLYAGVDGTVRKMSLDTSDATATAADIMQGKTAYTADGLVTGTLLQPCSENEYQTISCQNGVAVSLAEYSLVLFEMEQRDPKQGKQYVVIFPQTGKSLTFSVEYDRDDGNTYYFPQKLDDGGKWYETFRSMTYDANVNTILLDISYGSERPINIYVLV